MVNISPPEKVNITKVPPELKGPAVNGYTPSFLARTEIVVSEPIQLLCQCEVHHRCQGTMYAGRINIRK